MDTKETQEIRLLQAGDSTAQAQVYLDCLGQVHAICKGILGDSVDAMETAVDVLCDFIFSYAHRLKRPESGRSYLRLMAVRRSLRARERRNRSDDLELYNLPAAGDSPEQGANQVLLRPRLEQCLASLTPKAQQVIRLRYGHEMTNERIGDLVGGSKQYIGKLIQRSLELLRVCMERHARNEPREGGRRS